MGGGLRRRLPSVDFLIDRGADVNAVADAGKAALDIALERRNDAVADRLRAHGAVKAGKCA